MIRELSSQIRRRRLASFALAFAVTFMVLFVGIYTVYGLMELVPVLSEKKSSTTAKNKLLSHHTHRKLLNDGQTKLNLASTFWAGGKRKWEENAKEKRVEPTRIWSEKCSKSDIMISQGATEALPNGIPTYTVEIMNTCVSGCDISAIHLSCGWFSSARLVNPRVFKRLRFDDCLVNNGKPLLNGRTLSFQYANTFRYPLSVASISC